MEKVSFMRGGVLKLPPGFRFHPTDEELVVQYLKKKVFSFPLPASIIPEVDVCKSDPWDLPGELEQERYFFSTRETKYPNGHRSNRASGSGYWKATGIDKKIVNSKSNQVAGMKKTLVFYRGKPPHGSRTDWIMHEYRLSSPVEASLDDSLKTNSSLQGSMENWVVCRIFLKKRGGKNDQEGATEVVIGEESKVIKRQRSSRPVFYDFLRKDKGTVLNLGPASSSSESSGVTEVSCKKQSDDHEESSSCNSLPYFRRNHS